MSIAEGPSPDASSPTSDCDPASACDQRGADPVRERLRVQGVVQGVGFRPFVYRIARRHELGGFVLNDGQGVLIEVQGPAGALEAFVVALQAEAPPLARVLEVRRERLAPAAAEGEQFTIAASGQAGGTTLIPPDTATCEQCLAELRDPGDRRHRYAFTNCTNCGPRYTIIRSLPYDRPATTMSGFPLCGRCHTEYTDPGDRRFHAEPNACPVCGPQLVLLHPDGQLDPVPDPLRACAELLAQGGLVAIKGLGGYHLACDASSETAVRRLREVKGRDRKPFAVMARDLATAAGFAELGEDERRALGALDRPIVLLRRRRPFPLAEALAPGLDSVGVMLPYTPLHHLLLEEGPCPVLVMTSGNRSSEPIVAEQGLALELLGPMVDRLLSHDRPIHARADDSVVRVMGGRARPVRRSRGAAPEPVTLPALPAGALGPGDGAAVAGGPGGAGSDSGGRAVLAVGGALKNTICLTQGERAFLSPHIGDLDHPWTRDLLAETFRHLAALLNIEPELVVHDLHPDYPSTIWAGSLGLPVLGVQHHHAHALACLAEHRRREPAVALSLDGTGYGTDGTLWGGEVLFVDGLRCERLAHLVPLPLPGGERAIHEPWRLAVAAAWQAGAEVPEFPDVQPGLLQAVSGLVAGPAVQLMPRTSALGRYLDAAAALLGVSSVVGFEGEAPMRLEDAAQRYLEAHGGRQPELLPWSLLPAEREGGPLLIDLLPALSALPALRSESERAAAALHGTVIEAFAAAARRGCRERGVSLVALSGGVLQNRIFHERLSAELQRSGLEVLTHRLVPANDGGLALGQAWAGQLYLQQR